MDKEQALYNFWEGFEWPACDEQVVPDDLPLPYITYETSVSNFDNEIPLSASLWYRGNRWDVITKKAQEIIDYIGRGGRIVRYDGGAFWIKTTSPQYQRMSEPSDENIRRIVINVNVEFID